MSHVSGFDEEDLRDDLDAVSPVDAGFYHC